MDTKYGETYSVRYVHKISPRETDVGPDVEVPYWAWSSPKIMARALRELGVIAPGTRVKNFRVEGNVVVVFPMPGWHSVILTKVDESSPADEAVRS